MLLLVVGINHINNINVCIINIIITLLLLHKTKKIIYQHQRLQTGNHVDYVLLTFVSPHLKSPIRAYLE